MHAEERITRRPPARQAGTQGAGCAARMMPPLFVPALFAWLGATQVVEEMQMQDAGALEGGGMQVYVAEAPFAAHGGPMSRWRDWLDVWREHAAIKYYLWVLHAPRARSLLHACATPSFGWTAAPAAYSTMR